MSGKSGWHTLILAGLGVLGQRRSDCATTSRWSGLAVADDVRRGVKWGEETRSGAAICDRR